MAVLSKSWFPPVLLAMVVQCVPAQTVDCKSANTRVAQLICARPWLLDIDRQLAGTYAKALTAATASGKAAPLQRDQAEWLKTRDACPTAECVLRVENERISYLEKGGARSSPAPAPPRTAASPASGKIQPMPLFGGQIGVRSSQKGKESATLGFNGIDPSGKVQDSLLAVSPNAAQVAMVGGMDARVGSRQELAAFLREGGLHAR